MLPYVIEFCPYLKCRKCNEMIIMTWEKSERKPEWKDISSESLEVKHYSARYDTLILKDCVLYKKWESDCGKVVMWLIVLPK